jgi:hypothetical protein
LTNRNILNCLIGRKLFKSLQFEILMGNWFSSVQKIPEEVRETLKNVQQYVLTFLSNGEKPKGKKRSQKKEIKESMTKNGIKEEKKPSLFKGKKNI